MQRPLSLLVKATGAVAVCLLAYRGVQLYYKNDITIYVTEVVHLPEAAGRRRRPQADPNLTLTIEGKVEMEACLMNSYRFLLKLAGHVRTALPDTNKSSSTAATGQLTMSPRSNRHRVLSLQTSNNFRDDDSVSNASVSGKSKHGPTLLITSVDPIVDAYEAETSGFLTFTPACISDGLLCRYSCTASTADESGFSNNNNNNNSGSNNNSAGPTNSFERGNSVSSFVGASPAPRSVLQGGADSGLGSVYVRGCFLESDGETAYCQRLTVELEFIRPVYGARVVIRLPSKYCRLQRSSTGGLGTVTQLLHQPRKCVWDLGEITEAMCGVAPDGPGTSGVSGGALANGLPSVEELMPGAVVPAPDTSCARLELVFEQPPPGIAFGEDEDAYPSGGSDGSDDDDDNNFGSTVSSVKSASSRRRTRSASGRRWLVGSPNSAAAAASASTTSRARKREERARKVAEKAARILEAASSTEMRSRGGASSDDVPTVEVVFSVNQLLSGTAVKKLQVLQEAPNWQPRSKLDRLVLRRLLPSLEKMKLKKLAHYTTWFVQPVAVSQL